MPDAVKSDLRQALDRLIIECQAVGRLWKDASSRLVRVEALPPVELVHRVEKLRSDWESLLADASRSTGEGNRNPVAPPDPTTTLIEAIAFVEDALTYRQRHAQRAVVLDRVSKVMRLETRDGPALLNIAELRAKAMAFVQCVHEAAVPDSLEGFAEIAEGTHPYCQLLTLVEPSDSQSTDRASLAMDCALSFGREITKAAVEGRLAVATAAGADPTEIAEPAALGPASAAGPVRDHAEKPPTVMGSAVAFPESPGPSPVARGSEALIERVEPTNLRPSRRPIAPAPKPGPGPRRPSRPPLDDLPWQPWSGPLTSPELPIRITASTTTAPVVEPPSLIPGTESGPENDRSQKLQLEPLQSTLSRSSLTVETTGTAVAETPPTSDRDLRTEVEPPPTVEPVEVSPPHLTVLGGSAVGNTAFADVHVANAADREEILAHCSRGDYLGASLLAVGRAFAGLRDCDPGPEALLVAHHVVSGSSTAPWPDWSHDPEAAIEACEESPESSRLVLLAALNQITRAEGGGDPIAPAVKKALLTAFNNLPELRTWLDDVLDAVGIPGLWEQVCRSESARALDVYRDARIAFLERYEVGLQHRNANAAYIHRQDHYMSRLPATRSLHDHLKPGEPGTIGDDDRRKICGMLEKNPDDITDDWLESAIRPTTGGIRLKGNQKASLIKRAAVYLERMNRAWRAAEALRQSGPSPGEVGRRRDRFRGTLPIAREQSRGTPWDHLFSRLTEGLVP